MVVFGKKKRDRPRADYGLEGKTEGLRDSGNILFLYPNGGPILFAL